MGIFQVNYKELFTDTYYNLGTIDVEEMIEILINIFGKDKCGFSMSR